MLMQALLTAISSQQTHDLWLRQPTERLQTNYVEMWADLRCHPIVQVRPHPVAETAKHKHTWQYKTDK